MSDAAELEPATEPAGLAETGVLVVSEVFSADLMAEATAAAICSSVRLAC